MCAQSEKVLCKNSTGDVAAPPFSRLRDGPVPDPQLAVADGAVRCDVFREHLRAVCLVFVCEVAQNRVTVSYERQMVPLVGAWGPEAQHRPA